VELAREIAYVESYIKLQRLRFSDDQEVPIHFTVEGDPRQVHIAPMLLINFVENAFKHGVSLKQESFINVRVTVLDSQLRFLVENTIHRRDAKEQLEPGGLGLEHARKLLDLQYPGRYTLQQSEAENIFRTELTIQLKKKTVQVEMQV
jgi:two-component system, LytTR family, sensor kinase